MNLKESIRYRVTKGSDCGTIVKGDVIRRSGDTLINATARGILLKDDWEDLVFEAEMDAGAEKKAWLGAMTEQMEEDNKIIAKRMRWKR